MLDIGKMLNKLRLDARGGILIIGAFSIFALTILAIGGAEIANFVNRKSMIVSAADNAILAAASVSRTQNTEQVIARFFNANIPVAYQESIKLGKVSVSTNPQTLEWTTIIEAEIKTKFGALLGFDSFKVRHKVSVAWDIAGRLEAVFTMDSSASMCTKTIRSPRDDGTYILKYEPDYACTKLNQMKKGVEYVIDYGLSTIEGVGGPAFYAGIVPFNHKVKLPNPKSAPVQLIGSEVDLSAARTGQDPLKFTTGDPDYYTNLDDVEPLAPVIPLMALSSEDDKNKLKSLVRSIKQSPTGRGWTRSNIAVLTAAMMLDPEHYSVFGGATPQPFDPKKTEKVIIMMTDGANIGCCYAAHPEGNYNNQYLYLYEVDNAHLVGLENLPNLRKWAQKYNIPEKGLCTQMHENGITVYSVVYDIDDRDPGGKAIKDVYKACATNSQYYFDVQDEKTLARAYKTIAQSLLRLRISY
jgi:hypothetical protein